MSESYLRDMFKRSLAPGLRDFGFEYHARGIPYRRPGPAGEEGIWFGVRVDADSVHVYVNLAKRDDRVERLVVQARGDKAPRTPTVALRLAVGNVPDNAWEHAAREICDAITERADPCFRALSTLAGMERILAAASRRDVELLGGVDLDLGCRALAVQCAAGDHAGFERVLGDWRYRLEEESDKDILRQFADALRRVWDESPRGEEPDAPPPPPIDDWWQDLESLLVVPEPQAAGIGRHVIDQAAYHLGAGWPEELPREQAYVYGGLFLAWAIDRDLVHPRLARQHGELLGAFRDRALTGPQVYMQIGGLLESEMLSRTGRRFAERHFSIGYGHYNEDFGRTLADGLESPYHVGDTWENYERFAKVLDRRFDEAWTGE